MVERLPILHSGVGELGHLLDENQYALFDTYLTQLTAWNERFNLTSITNWDEIQRLHFLDSLTVVCSGIDLANKRIIDIGSGAGFPGLPLKIAFQKNEVALLEATRKKADFLSYMITHLGLSGISVINSRSEDAAHQETYRQLYDVAVSRAVASLNTLCELSLPFCRIGGYLIAMKKGDINAELDSSLNAIRIMGGRLQDVISIKLNCLPDERRLIVIEKIAITPDIYPRRSGLPAKRPLR